MMDQGHQGIAVSDNWSLTSGDVPLDVLSLSTRAYNCLRRAGLRTVAELASLTDEQILSIRQAGDKTLAEIHEKLTAYLDEHPVPELTHPQESQWRDRTYLSGETLISILRLSPDAYNALMQVSVLTLGQLVQMSSWEILNIQGINKRILAEIERKLQPYRVLLFPEQAVCSGSERFVSEVNLSSSDDRAVPEDTPIDVLGLSSWSHNALRYRGVNTLGQLAQMSSRQIRGIYRIDEKSLAEIEDKLEAYLTEHSLRSAKPVESELSVLLIDSALQKRADCAPLDDISVERLNLPEIWQNQLLQAGISSIGELMCQTTDTSTRADLLRERLKYYLTWLAYQDEATWADEVAGQDISPLHRMEWSETPLDDLIEGWLSSSEHIDERDRCVIRWRYGLHGEQLTLEEVGDRFGVSRERVRQLEKRALNHLSKPQNLAAIRPLIALLVYLLEQGDGLMSEGQIEAALKQELVVNNIDPIGVAHLVFETNNDVKWLRGTEAWGLKSTPLDEVLGVQKRLTRILEKEYIPLAVDELIARFKSTRFYRNRQDILGGGFVLACLWVHTDIDINGEDLCVLREWSGKRLPQMILALRELGEPSHYSVIAERTNALLPPEQQASVHNIHAHMQRLPDIFVHVGLRGKYGLKEWGLEQALPYEDALAQILQQAGHPLTFQQILAEMPKVRPYYEESSLVLTLGTNERFRSFPGDTYGLAEWQEDEVVTEDYRLKQLFDGVEAASSSKLRREVTETLSSVDSFIAEARERLSDEV